MKGRQDRTAIADFLNPVNGYRGQLELMGKKPKDHRKENLKLIKQKEEENKKLEEEKAKGKGEPWKMKKFQNIQSKVKETLSQTDNQSRPQTAVSRPQTAVSRKDKPAHVAFGRSTSQNNSEDFEYKNTEDKENEQSEYNKIEYTDNQSEHQPIEKHKNFGKVPAYIEKYKEEHKIAEEKKQEEKAKSNIPEGTRLMGEDERVKTLEELNLEKRQISDLIFSMPLSMKTEALKNKKRELEQKLIEIERAITTFSRKVVYIRDENTDHQSVTNTPKVFGKFQQVPSKHHK
ncbi:UNKNOWN [Stylonychia lemnae]|uniref:Enkurin domain-containing protein n=1 Tax=Stylonychia lemnae TaxID=5949 RepID=A0A078ACX7_STYLE|nr:UNKNOWN [Stylonychia lemnae]|eukprot:CDW80069.1 UNKNOWN [Stylonychia lemnae]